MKCSSPVYCGLSSYLLVLCSVDAYVSDELFTSRAGVRVRIGNTDAEGRMAMADVLCEMKEKVGPLLYCQCYIVTKMRHCRKGMTLSQKCDIVTKMQHCHKN